MPNRTPEARKLIDSLSIKEPDDKCNARTSKGYCNLPSGHGTDHLGHGRCKFHGGQAGRPIVHGLYSDKLVSTIKDEYEKLVTDPLLVDLNAEMAVIKTLLGNLLTKVDDKILGGKNFWIQAGKNGKEISAEAKILITVLDQISKMYKRIVDAEQKVQNSLSIRDVYLIVNQIKLNMNSTCGICPVRKTITEKLANAKMVKVIETETLPKQS